MSARLSSPVTVRLSARQRTLIAVTFALALLVFTAGMGLATNAAGDTRTATATATATVSRVAVARPIATVTPVIASPCQMLRLLPGYRYRYQGATVTEPTGDVRYREMTTDGVRGAALHSACRAMVRDQVRAGGAPAPVLAVYRELRLG